MKFLSTRCAVSILAIGLAIELTHTFNLYADMPDSIYQSAIQAAQVKSKRLNQARNASLSGSILKNLFGRSYQPGDSWDVVAWTFEHPSTPSKKSAGNFSSAQSKLGPVGLFHYEVVAPRAPDTRAYIRITQLPTKGPHNGPNAVLDPQISEIKIGFTEQLIETEKTYTLRSPAPGRNGATDLTAFNNNYGRTSPLELVPLDIPDVVTAEQRPTDKLPVLPESIRTIAQQAGYSPQLKNSWWFDQDDFFGRPTEVLWEKGKPWPTYIKTINGIALLVQQPGAL